MLSAAPGVLLAAELVKGRLDPAGQTLGSERNLLATGILGPHNRWTSWRAKQPRCECADDVFRAAYSNCWETGRLPRAARETRED